MILCNIGHSFDYETEKLIRIFLPFEKILISHELCEDERMAVCSRSVEDERIYVKCELHLSGKSSCHSSRVRDKSEKECELEIARQLYYCFVDITGYVPEWGILTGIRPAKLFSHIISANGKEKAEAIFKEDYKVQPSKISLCSEALHGENKIISLSKPLSFSLYLSVPFCPSRCSYCSFVSHSVDKAHELIPEYVDYLCKELEITAQIAKANKLQLETVYMGGGTPTTLSPEQMDRVLSTVRDKFDMSAVREFTVEAGRPDTITQEKLQIIKQNGVNRISINPQTLNDEVLRAIGRNHNAKQMFDAFYLARKLGFDNINTDLIAGLPRETTESFADTLEQIIKLDPESVTVHSLSMKRASGLTAAGEFPELKAGREAARMVEYARHRLTENGILPYYMYRQSKTVGNLENVGYAKRGYEGFYNVYIMDETHTILACGASAVSKLKSFDDGSISRIFNFKYPYEYIGRFDELIARKEGIGEFYDKYFKTYK